MSSTSSTRGKLFLLTNLASPHSIKWVRGLSDRGFAITAFSLSPYDPATYSDLPHFTGHTVGLDDSLVKTTSGRWAKLRYLTQVGRIRALIRESNPDIVHAHRASSYGLLGVLSGGRPLVVSVWGDDVYVFPRKGQLFKRIIKFVLGRADVVLSTSEIMASETAKYTDKPITVTPFGINTEQFCPLPAPTAPAAPPHLLTIGTIKTLEKKYGIDVLIRAFALVTERSKRQDLQLLIVGQGTERPQLERLVKELGLSNVIFAGRIPYDEVVTYHNRIDIFAALSTIDAESFGVSIIEASACGRPVVVSDAGGPAEVVEEGETGFIVPRNDEEAAAAALLRLVNDSELRRRMGEAGRKHVRQHYEWRENLSRMEKVYDNLRSTTR